MTAIEKNKRTITINQSDQSSSGKWPVGSSTSMLPYDLETTCVPALRQVSQILPVTGNSELLCCRGVSSHCPSARATRLTHSRSAFQSVKSKLLPRMKRAKDGRINHQETPAWMRTRSLSLIPQFLALIDLRDD